MTIMEAVSKEDEPFTNLYVKCFPSHFKEQDLCELFDGFGPIQAAKIMTDQRGRHFGFVNFEQPNDAKECVKMMHCKDLRTRKEQREAKKLEAEGKAPPVKLDVDGHPEHLLYVSRAQKKEEREAMFQKQLAEKGLLKGAAKGKGKGDGNPRDPRDLRDPRDRDPRDLRDPRDPRDRDPRDSFGKGGVQSLQSIPMATLPRPVHTPSTLVSDVPSSSGNWSTPLYSQFGNGSSYTNGTSHLSSAGYTNGNGNAGWSESNWHSQATWSTESYAWDRQYGTNWDGNWGGNTTYGSSTYGGCDGFDGVYSSHEHGSNITSYQAPSRFSAPNWQI